MCDCMWFFFFFKQKTAYDMRISDWSSDVCSSDLAEGARMRPSPTGFARPPARHAQAAKEHKRTQTKHRDTNPTAATRDAIIPDYGFRPPHHRLASQPRPP